MPKKARAVYTFLMSVSGQLHLHHLPEINKSQSIISEGQKNGARMVASRAQY